MSLFKKLFGSSSPSSEDENDKKERLHILPNDVPIEEQFIYNFKKNGGKFLYCENTIEIHDHLENILAENDWFEGAALCYEADLYALLDDNKITYQKIENPLFFLTYCENLIATEGSILFSSQQIKQHKPSEFPANIVVIATISQIIQNTSDGLSHIKKKYKKDYPSNITTIKYFKKVVEEDFTQYGSAAKNLYLLLLEDL
jgi:hypothetical protein